VDTARALLRYQHGDYLSASGVFESLTGKVESAEFPLFHANALLLGGKYVEAEASYTAYLQVNEVLASAAYNNLGVALNNRDVSLYKEPSLQGLAEFDRAIEISAAGNLSDIRSIDVGSIALFNRSRIHLLDGRYEDALADCEAIRGINSNSALAYVCLANYSMTRYRFTTLNLPGRLPLNTIDQNLADAEKRTPHPPITHFLRAVWHLDHAWEQKQNAVDEFALYISEMQNQACLSTDQMFVTDAQTLIEQYSQ
jgi:tetratricopeptide (TPR) repeat protein